MDDWCEVVVPKGTVTIIQHPGDGIVGAVLEPPMIVHVTVPADKYLYIWAEAELFDSFPLSSKSTGGSIAAVRSQYRLTRLDSDQDRYVVQFENMTIQSPGWYHFVVHVYGVRLNNNKSEPINSNETHMPFYIRQDNVIRMLRG